MPAELFPTRYRSLCHGISAAFGKLGSVIAQLFLAYINYGHGIDYQKINKWLPYSLLMYAPLPFLLPLSSNPPSLTIFLKPMLTNLIQFLNIHAPRPPDHNPHAPRR
jgi:hypothetical protein